MEHEDIPEHILAAYSDPFRPPLRSRWRRWIAGTKIGDSNMDRQDAQDELN